MSRKIKRIVVFGAGGRMGREVVEAAVRRGMEVRQPNSRNYDDVTKLKTLLKGVEAAVIVFGPLPPYTDIFCARATRNIIRAMKAAGVKRLLCQTGAMTGDYRKNRTLIFEKFSKIYRKQNPEGYKDRVDQERVVRESGLKWRLIKPPRLTMDDRERKVWAGEEVRVGLMSSISRKGLADFICEELEEENFNNRTVFVKN